MVNIGDWIKTHKTVSIIGVGALGAYYFFVVRPSSKSSGATVTTSAQDATVGTQAPGGTWAGGYGTNAGSSTGSSPLDVLNTIAQELAGLSNPTVPASTTPPTSTPPQVQPGGGGDALIPSSGGVQGTGTPTQTSPNGPAIVPTNPIIATITGTTKGATTAQPTATNLPTTTVTSPTGTTTEYQGIGNENVLRALANRGFTIYARTTAGTFVPVQQGTRVIKPPSGVSLAGAGRFYNPAQAGVH